MNQIFESLRTKFINKRTEPIWYKNYTEIGQKLLLKVYSENDTENSICSPFSFYVFLGIILEATAGKTQKETRDVLTKGLSVEEHTDIIKSLQQDFTCKNAGAKLKSSNGICIRKAFFDSVQDKFKKLFQKYFDGEIFAGDTDMIEKINSWVNEKTNGMIPRLLDQVPADIRMVLMNAIAFEAKWETIYEDRDVLKDCRFANGDGTISEVIMLSSTENDYIEDDYYTGFIKNYKGGTYALLALLPKEKNNKDFFKRALEQVDFKAYYESRQKYEVNVRIPEFEIEESTNLTSFCKEIGINSIFMETADFSNIVVNESLMIDSVLQKAFIRVDRSGTKAAAVTAIEGFTSCAPDFDNIKYVTLDRPFVYSIINRENGLPVFSGIVNRL